MVVITCGIGPCSGPGPFRQVFQQHAGGRVSLSADQAAPQVEGDRPNRRMLLPAWRVGLTGQVRDIQPQGGGQRCQPAAAIHPLPARLQPGEVTELQTDAGGELIPGQSPAAAPGGQAGPNRAASGRLVQLAHH
ncbi:hypothetical protein [Streptomyces sp. NBC_00829]|uniref:hypothetical protein n=1 Tax=Streptomyces sp. NBC_00829 TaxID=2903679 RepID=UPI00386970DC